MEGSGEDPESRCLEDIRKLARREIRLRLGAVSPETRIENDHGCMYLYVRADGEKDWSILGVGFCPVELFDSWFRTVNSYWEMDGIEELILRMESAGI